MYQELADMACERITAAITRAESAARPPVKAVLDPYNPIGSTATSTSTPPRRVAGRPTPPLPHQLGDPRQRLGRRILPRGWRPIRAFGPAPTSRTTTWAGGPLPHGQRDAPLPAGLHRPGRRRDGDDDPLHLVVEIKGYRGEDAKRRSETMDTYWVPGVNNHGNYGRWAFAEFVDVWEMQADFETKVKEHFNQMIDGVIAEPVE
jgi:type III restriction enzyme